LGTVDLHPRRRLRSDRERGRRHPDQSRVRPICIGATLVARKPRDPSLHGKRAGRRAGDRLGRLHQSGHPDRDVSGDE
jgi:hypothetical protein